MKLKYHAVALALCLPAVTSNAFAETANHSPTGSDHIQIAQAQNAVLPAVQEMGFDEEVLGAKIYLLQYAGGPYEEWKSFAQFVSLLMQNPKIKRVEPRYISDGDDVGVGIKFPGRPPMVLLFKRDDDEMFASWLGNDTQLHPMDSAMNQQQIADVIKALVQ